MQHRDDEYFRGRILRYFGRARKAASADAVMAALRLKKAERPAFLLMLKKLETEGTLVRNKKGKYVLSQEENGGVRGRILSLSKGFAFARLEESGEDCFIAGRNLLNALPGDIVRIRLGAPDIRGPQGTVTAIEEKGGRLYIGQLLPKEEGRSYVQPDAAIRFPLQVRKSTLGDARPGDKVRFSVSFKEERPVASW